MTGWDPSDFLTDIEKECFGNKAGELCHWYYWTRHLTGWHHLLSGEAGGSLTRNISWLTQPGVSLHSHPSKEVELAPT